jgi:hypothetical protein
MRNLLIPATLAFFALGAVGLGSSKAKLPPLPGGTLSGNSYSNDALGIRYDFPSEWTAIADPKGPTKLDGWKPDGPANRCSQVLLTLKAPHPVEGRFSSEAILFAIDPGCISAPDFPRSAEERDKVGKVVDKVIKVFKNTPYISPYGVHGVAFMSHGRQGKVIFQLTGGLIINAIDEIDGHPSPKKEPLTVNTSLALAESKGYWVAWAYLADDPSKEDLNKSAKIAFEDDLSQ